MAQQEGRSTVHTIFGFYERECPFTPALVELLDGMLQINPRRRMPMGQVAASAWLAPAPLSRLKLDLTAVGMGASTSSIISSAESPASTAASGTYSPYDQHSPGKLDYEADLAITGDEANLSLVDQSAQAALAAQRKPFSVPAKKGCRGEQQPKGRVYAMDLETNQAVLLPR